VEDLKFGKLKINSYINIMEKVKKYKKQIVTFITIFLLATYGIFPALTAANTLLNLVGGIGGLVLLLWAGLELKDYITSNENQPFELTKEQSEKIISNIEDKGLYVKPKRKYTKKTK
jgi:hypothetical protein